MGPSGGLMLDGDLLAYSAMAISLFSGLFLVAIHNPLRGDPTSVANRLIQGEWYSRDADVYRAAAERYMLWLVQSIDLAGLPRTPERVLDLLEPNQLMSLLRRLRPPEAP